MTSGEELFGPTRVNSPPLSDFSPPCARFLPPLGNFPLPRPLPALRLFDGLLFVMNIEYNLAIKVILNRNFIFDFSSGKTKTYDLNGKIWTFRLRLEMLAWQTWIKVSQLVPCNPPSDAVSKRELSFYFALSFTCHFLVPLLHFFFLRCCVNVLVFCFIFIIFKWAWELPGAGIYGKW